MAVFDEIGFGGITTGGCAAPTHTCRREIYFGPGDIAYSVRSAQLGLLEKVGIRKRKMLWFGRTQSVLYTDSRNGMWKEEDLVDLATAKAIVAGANLNQIELLGKFRTVLWLR